MLERMRDICCDYGVSVGPGGDLDPPIEYILNYDSERVMGTFEEREPQVARSLGHQIRLEKIRRKERLLEVKKKGDHKEAMDEDEDDEKAKADAKAEADLRYQAHKEALRAKLTGSGSQSPAQAKKPRFGKLNPALLASPLPSPDRFGVGGRAPLTPVFGGSKYAKPVKTDGPTQTQPTTQSRKNFLKQSKNHIVIPQVKETFLTFKFEEGCTNA